MKINILIMTWINRVLMISFLISILLLVVDLNNFFYAMYLSFAVGCFQVFSLLITLFYQNRIKVLKLILIYVISIILYFFSVFLFFEFERHIPIKDIVFIIFWIIPVLLSIFWTYILESINKEL